MTTLREAAQQALEALGRTDSEPGTKAWEREGEAMEALRAALAEPRSIQECYGDCPTNPRTCPNPCNFEGRSRPVQEPVAWRTFDGEGGYDYRTYEDNESYAAEWEKRNPRHVGWVEPLYTAPRPAEPVQEPVAWVECDGDLVWNNREAAIGRNLYISPQPQQTEPSQDTPTQHEYEVTANDDGTFSVALPDGEELRIIPPQRSAEPVQEPVAVVRSVVGQGDDGVRIKWLSGFPQIGDRLYTAPPQRKPPATIDEMFGRMDKAPKGVFFGHDPMTIWMEAWRAAEQQHGIT